MITHFGPVRVVVSVVAVVAILGVFWSRAAVSDLTLRIQPASFFDGYLVFISGQSATNFVFESSDDLNSWQTIYQSFGFPSTNAVHEAAPSFEVASRRFWRALPGESLAEQKQRWLENEPADYTFRLRRMFSFWEGGVRGTVRVRKGSIVEVTNAVDDLTGQPIAEPDVSQFLTIAQIFEEIRQEFEEGSEHIRVNYDPSGLFPARVWIDRLMRAADDESVIEATDFSVVEP